MPQWTSAFASAALALLVALALDRWAGARLARWHPVAWPARYLGWIGGLIAPRQAQPSPNWPAFCAGALAWYGGGMLAVLAAVLLQALLLRLHSAAAGLLLGVLLWPTLRWWSLRREVAAVEPALAQSLHGGRRQLARIASHEVMRLDAAQVRESAMVCLARQFDTGLVAPLFWFVVAGLPGAVLYRFARTADELWGWPGFRAGVHWQWAGKWAARADDVLGWLPARFAALLLAMAAGGAGVMQLRAEAGRAASPNSGWAAAALALGLQLRLGLPGRQAFHAQAAPPGPQAMAAALRLCGRAGVLVVLWALLMLAALRWGRSL